MRFNANNFNVRPRPRRRWSMAVTLIELLCVIAVIGILAALYLGVISKVFVKIKHFLGGLGGL